MAFARSTLEHVAAHCDTLLLVSMAVFGLLSYSEKVGYPEANQL